MWGEEHIYWPLALALGLGLLIGLQREWARQMAGIRTFPLIAMLGAASALISEHVGGWIFSAALLLVGAALALLYHEQFRRAEDDEREDEPPAAAEDTPRAELGLTTIIAALLTFIIGAMPSLGYPFEAILLAGTTAVLLQLKEPLHRFVGGIGEAEIRAVFKLALIALVILPALPDETLGPYDVLNPFHIWLMVVLIVGISVTGYLIYNYLGERAGVILGGILGGLVSSTATTVSFARRAREVPAASDMAAATIMIASALAFARVAGEVLIVAPDLAGEVLPQFGVMGALMAALAIAAGLRLAGGGDAEREPLLETENPANLRAAVIFGGLYALILLAVAAAQEHFGDRGVYVVAILSGLTDVDAITLSTAQMMKSERIVADTGWRMMFVAALSNIAFKGGVVAVLGSRPLLKRVGALFGVALAGGALLLWLWPEVA